MLHYSFFLFLGFTTVLHLTSAQCKQRGCKDHGLFYQDTDMEMLKSDYQPKIVWEASVLSTQTHRMSMEMDLMGCVSNDRHTVCPYWPDNYDHSVYILLENQRGSVIAMLAVLQNGSMPVLTDEGYIIAANSTHIAHQHSDGVTVGTVFSLPQSHPLGVLAPVLLEDYKLVVIPGNMSAQFTTWRYDREGVTLVENFEIADKDFSNCSWVPVSNMAASKNRLYMYSINLRTKDMSEGFIAFDILEDGKHKFAWKIADSEKFNIVSTGYASSVREAEDPPVCGLPDDIGPQEGLPQLDISLQSIATPDGVICFTSGIGLFVVKDDGDSGEQVYGYLNGDHYLTYAPPVNHSSEGKIWMSGWTMYPPWKDSLMATNSTAAFIGLTPVLDLNVTTINVTSQMTTFNNPNDPQGQKIIVFGAEVETNKSNTISYKSILLALQTSSADDYHPKIIWTVDLPNSPNQEDGSITSAPDRSRFVVRGQLAASNNMIMFYMSDGVTGHVYAVA